MLLDVTTRGSGMTKEEQELKESIAFLIKRGYDLRNMHFTPGPKATRAEAFAEAIRVMRSAEEQNLPHNPPHTGLPQKNLRTGKTEPR